MKRLIAQKIYSVSSRESVRIEPLIENLKHQKFTGLLRVGLNACNGVIIFGKGTIIDSYEIFKNIAVKDQGGTTIITRYKAESGSIDIYEVHEETLQILLKTLKRMPTEEFPALKNTLAKKCLKYQIYNYRYNDPLIPNKKIAEIVNCPVSTLNRYAKQAEKEKVILNPQLRLDSSCQKIALLLFEDKWRAFNKLKKFENILYLCIYQGTWDIMAVYNQSMDFSQIPGFRGNVAAGFRKKLFSPKVSFTYWENCFAEMEIFIEQKDVQKSRCTNESCPPEWDDEEWIMFNYFRSNIRKSFNHLRKKIPISWRKFEKWKSTLNEFCIILVTYYPQGYDMYDTFSLCFKTEYEEYIMKLFSFFPTSPLFCKFGEYLCANISVKWDYQQQMKIYDIISQLLKRNIITNYIDGKVITTWQRPSKWTDKTTNWSFI